MKSVSRNLRPVCSMLTEPVCTLETYICPSCGERTGLRTISEYPDLLPLYVARTTVLVVLCPCPCTSFMYHVNTFALSVHVLKRPSNQSGVGSIDGGVCACAPQEYDAVKGGFGRCLCSA